MMARALAAEAAANEMQVPAFAMSWVSLLVLLGRQTVHKVALIGVLPLESGDALGDNGTTEVRAKEVAAHGICCTIDVKKLAPGQPLNTSPNEGGGRLELQIVSPRQVISSDSQAEELMEQYDCDLAISSSTLITLFDSDTSTRFAHVSIVQGSTGGRTAYHIWQLDDKRILVRSTTQASMAAPSLLVEGAQKQHTKQTVVPLSVFVKPDYNLLGVEEQLTTSERCRFWLHSWLRGGSSVLVARVNPKKDVVTSWKIYSPASLIHGEKTQQTVPLDTTSKFRRLSKLFAAISDVPVGSYLLRPHDSHGSSTFGKKRGGVEVLMATAEPGIETEVIDLNSFMPRRADGSAASQPIHDSILPVYPVLPSWNLRDRIPYTYQTGMYCALFFLEGKCPQISRGENCEHIHLRLVEQSGGIKKVVKAKRWKFENYTKVLKKAARSNFEMLNRPVLVTLSYAFCGEENAPVSTPSATDLQTQVRCSRSAGECTLPHFTLHQILERLADDLLRKGRGKRREQKNHHRQQHRKPE
ncbi:unnamed protein product [Phytophthora fragariaefolia]|uniref:Unnamed protein product n=1 Tax=Phytophthora fragariaefolia TaxID=1490495 RepID=A0A9W6XX37_9STRA|nr:unnamed protein product [Phytophthora fragariaefolia]